MWVSSLGASLAVKESILIVAPTRSAAAAHRASSLADVLREGGHPALVTDASHALRGAWTRHRCAVTLSPGDAAHLVGYALQRRGAKWIADIDPPSELATGRSGAAARIRWRMTMSADALIAADESRREAIFRELHASAALVPNDAAETINQLVSALIDGRPERLRILMLGPVNSPHMEHLALALRDRGNAVRAAGALWGGGLEACSLPDNGIPVSPLASPQISSLRRLRRRFRPDVIHANWMPFAVLATLAGARPLVAMAWGSDVYLAGRHQLLMYRLVVRRAALVLADSRALLERLIELGAPRRRTAIFNWGVDLTRLKPADDRTAVKRELGLDAGPVIIGARGLKALYNPQVLLDAFSQVRRARPDAQLIFKHQGDGEAELARLALPDGVRVVGRIPFEKLVDYFRAAEVCVSIPDTDSSPRSVWEAMACGCACVLSDLPWVHEQIRSGEHALVTPVDASEVANAIERLLDDAELQRTIVIRARQLVERHHDARAQMDRLEQLYGHLAGRATYDQAHEESVDTRR
jgi:glycosyltransferase involved in cell wall biosynthesis